jgi:hypothetical protein
MALMKLEEARSPYRSLIPMLTPSISRINPAMYGLNKERPVGREFMAATPVPRFSGVRESAKIAEVGGNWKTINPWIKAPIAIHSQLGANTYRSILTADK